MLDNLKEEYDEELDEDEREDYDINRRIKSWMEDDGVITKAAHEEYAEEDEEEE